ncbi:MAG: DUF4365 domain-containing protein [Thermodesulfobacteriota bacterium]|nr:DUF4365 domain-containing protein [Thermodesulfobacteriota bacterium]
MSAKNADKVLRGKENRLQGNWGEHFIASELASQDCFVRNVTEGHDTGIDLYCETTSKGDPFLHFWCQVKTDSRVAGQALNLSSTRHKLNKHKDYWLSQPVPVFIFLVPVLERIKDEKKGENKDKQKHDTMTPYYIFRAIDFNGQEDGSIKSKYKIVHDESETNIDKGIITLKYFIEKRLPIETFLWDLKNGKVSYLKEFPDSSYVIKFPRGHSQRYEDKLSESLRWTLRILSDDILFEGKIPSNILSNNEELIKHKERYDGGKLYARLLELFADSKEDKHYDTYEIIGLYYEVAKDYLKAKEYYKKSLEQIENDPKIKELKKNDPKKKSFEDASERIKGHIARVKVKLSGKKPNGPASSNAASATPATHS